MTDIVFPKFVSAKSLIWHFICTFVIALERLLKLPKRNGAVPGFDRVALNM
jgi:hypothetical protein